MPTHTLLMLIQHHMWQCSAEQSLEGKRHGFMKLRVNFRRLQWPPVQKSRSRSLGCFTFAEKNPCQTSCAQQHWECAAGPTARQSSLAMWTPGKLGTYLCRLAPVQINIHQRKTTCRRSTFAGCRPKSSIRVYTVIYPESSTKTVEL